MIAEELKEAEKLYPAWIEEAFREAASLNKRARREHIRAYLWSVAQIKGKGSGEPGERYEEKGSPRAATSKASTDTSSAGEPGRRSRPARAAGDRVCASPGGERPTGPQLAEPPRRAHEKLEAAASSGCSRTATWQFADAADFRVGARGRATTRPTRSGSCAPTGRGHPRSAAKSRRRPAVAGADAATPRDWPQRRSRPVGAHEPLLVGRVVALPLRHQVLESQPRQRSQVAVRLQPLEAAALQLLVGTPAGHQPAIVRLAVPQPGVHKPYPPAARAGRLLLPGFTGGRGIRTCL